MNIIAPQIWFKESSKLTLRKSGKKLFQGKFVKSQAQFVPSLFSLLRFLWKYTTMLIGASSLWYQSADVLFLSVFNVSYDLSWFSSSLFTNLSAFLDRKVLNIKHFSFFSILRQVLLFLTSLLFSTLAIYGKTFLITLLFGTKVNLVIRSQGFLKIKLST